MAFLKKKAYNQTYKSFGSDINKEHNDTTTNILHSLFSNIKEIDIITIDDNEDCLEPSLLNKDDYILVSSPICTTDTTFDTTDLHNPYCPITTTKPTNINLYTRYNANCFSNFPTYYLVFYNVVISTGYRNHKEVCCASVKIDYSTIVGSSGFMGHLQKTICCETLYTNKIETVQNIEDNIYLDSITKKIGDEKGSLSSIFVDFYNVLLSVFEDVYPSCIMFGLNNMVVKNIKIDTNKIFSMFLEKIKEQYNFYYKHTNDICLTDEIEKIQSWLASPITEKLSCLNSDENCADFFHLFE